MADDSSHTECDSVDLLRKTQSQVLVPNLPAANQPDNSSKAISSITDNAPEEASTAETAGTNTQRQLFLEEFTETFSVSEPPVPALDELILGDGDSPKQLYHERSEDFVKSLHKDTRPMFSKLAKQFLEQHLQLVKDKMAIANLEKDSFIPSSVRLKAKISARKRVQEQKQFSYNELSTRLQAVIDTMQTEAKKLFLESAKLELEDSQVEVQYTFCQLLWNCADYVVHTSKQRYKSKDREELIRDTIWLVVAACKERVLRHSATDMSEIYRVLHAALKDDVANLIPNPNLAVLSDSQKDLLQHTVLRTYRLLNGVALQPLDYFFAAECEQAQSKVLKKRFKKRYAEAATEELAMDLENPIKVHETVVEIATKAAQETATRESRKQFAENRAKSKNAKRDAGVSDKKDDGTNDTKECAPTQKNKNSKQRKQPRKPAEPANNTPPARKKKDGKGTPPGNAKAVTPTTAKRKGAASKNRNRSGGNKRQKRKRNRNEDGSPATNS